MTLFARLLAHRTLVPLTFLTCLIAGIVALGALNKQLWPDYQSGYGVVTIAWPDAPIAAVDRQISRRVNDLLNDVGGIADVTTVSDRGRSNTSFRILQNEDSATVIRDVEQAVRGLWALPPDAQPALVRLIKPQDAIGRLMVSGPFDATAAQAVVDAVVTTMAEHGITQVTQIAPPPRSVAIDVDQRSMQAYGLSPSDIESRLTAFFAPPRSFSIQSDTSNRSVELRRAAASDYVGDIALASDPVAVRLSDIARIDRTTDVSSPLPVFREGLGVFFQLNRGSDDDLLDLSRSARNAVQDLRATFPDTMSFELFDVQADRLEQRVWLLAENAGQGVALVFLVLLVSVGLRAAIFVSVGLITTFAMSFLIMHLTGQSINYVSVFAMIMVIGILVDDSIVVVERIDDEMAQDPAQGSEQAILRAVSTTWRPVLVATVTTIAGFAPILLLRDSIGSYVAAIPLFVCTALAASYIECFAYLPHHMKGAKPQRRQWSFFSAAAHVVLAPVRWASGMGRALSGLFSAAVIGGSVWLLVGGGAAFTFWLNPETHVAIAYLTLPEDTTLAETQAEMEHVWTALDTIRSRDGTEDAVTVTFGIYGQHFLKPFHDFDPGRSSVFVELASGPSQTEATAAFVEKWQAALAASPGRAVVSIGEQRIGLEAADLEVVLTHANLDQLRLAAQALEARLADDPRVADVTNSLVAPSEALVIRPIATAQSIGGPSPEQIEAAVVQSLQQLTGENLRNPAEGRWILRFGDPDDPEGTLQQARISNLSGAVARDAVTVDRGFSIAALSRREGALSATFSINFEPSEGVDADLRRDLEGDILPSLAAEYGVAHEFFGAGRVQDDTLQSLAIASVLAIFLMFATLAISFGDYRRPILVLITLPVGAASGIVGHMVMGYPVTLLSLVAFLGLSGIMVNDLVLLINAFDDWVRRGLSHRDAVQKAFASRLRAIVLTSITTTLGLLPLMLDRSSEARFLIPIAISIVFGLVFAMLINLVLFPWTVNLLMGNRRTVRSGV